MKYAREIQILVFTAIFIGLYVTLVAKQANFGKILFSKRRHPQHPLMADQIIALQEETGRKIYADPRHDYHWRQILSQDDLTATEAIPPQVVII